MATEFELKYRCDPDRQARIREEHPGHWEEIPMSTTYFDTPDSRLSARHWTLRHRREGEKDICTLKTPAQGSARQEWEVECADILLAIPELVAASGIEELSLLAGDGLNAVCGARFTRYARLLEVNGCSAELALDSGILLGGGKELPLCEVELELKSGDSCDLVDFAARFQKKYCLTAEPKSKFARAKALAQED